MAVSSRRSEILRAFAREHFTRSTYLELDIEGVPNVSRVAVFAWPEPPGRPVRIGIDVVRVGQQVLRREISTSFDLIEDERPPATDTEVLVVTAEELAQDFEEDRPAQITLGAAIWQLVPAGRQTEVIALDRLGQPIHREVDTSLFCYRLSCPRCGRLRYAKRNSIHQVSYCWVCTTQARLRVRAVQDFRKRERARLEQPRRIAPHEEDQIVELAAQDVSGTEIARRFGVGPSAISKILLRRGRR